MIPEGSGLEPKVSNKKLQVGLDCDSRKVD